MTEELTQQVTRQIEEAFADTPYPGDENMSTSATEGLDEDFHSKHWRDVPLKSLFTHRGDLMFFTPAAFRFYLPAFMLGVLKHNSEVDTLGYNLIAHLSPDPYRGLPDPPKLDFESRLKQRTADFTSDEATAVLAFLKSYRVLHSENFEQSLYGDLLDGALPFWEVKVKDNIAK